MRRFFVEGSDPGVGLRSTAYVDEDIILTVMGKYTRDALWLLYKELEKILSL